MQEPTEIKISKPEYAPQFSGAKHRLTEKWDTYQYVPLFRLLEALLSDSTVLEQVEECSKRIRTDGLLEDFCDGTLYRNHPLFFKIPMLCS